ncbi:MAG TPA: glycerate kinase [Acidimicrobiaceae bacterium]|nr:glycerate kinase [Acidimicrobiaceae bacterium]
MRVVAAPDKFRGTATAAEVAAAVGRAARAAGWRCDEIPVADGGDGLLDVLGGPNRTSVVTGPLGDPVEAGWRYERGTAVIEMARASGLLLAGGPEGNDPIAADTHGTGELIQTAVEAGATRVIVGLGGSATTDGGLGALRALYPHQRLRAVELLVACDVRTRFLDAAAVFGPQKGASRAQVRLLTNRLARLADVYLEDHGVDVRDLPGAGAAGGLAGGLAAIGAQLLDGFALVADELELDQAVEGADLVVTGEGFLDDASFEGKVVGGVAELAADLGVPVVAVVGEEVDLDSVHAAVRECGIAEVVSLVERFGRERAMSDTVGCVERVVADVLAARS